MTMRPFDSSESLGNQSRWHIFSYLVRIGDFPGAFSCIFWKLPKRDRSKKATNRAIKLFIETLGKLAPDLNVTIDQPRSTKGEIFFDIKGTDVSTEASYKPGFGFGIYTSSPSYGQRPDEVHEAAEKAAERLAGIRDAARA